MQGTVLADRFEVMAVAGSGGMATVYRALDRQRREIVAIKILDGAQAGDRARFEREADLLAGLSHPHIARYVARGATPEGTPFLALEWIEGPSLSARLWARRPTISEALELAAKLASAIGAAHRAGVVHRDVKPSNVVLVGGNFREPKLLDFGIARVLGADAAMTRTGTTLGTPAYMAPEQVRGARDVDARVDTYGLGCVLFECLAGRAPFEGDDLMATLAKVLFDEAPRLSNFWREVPPELDHLCAALLAKDPQGRPASGDVLASAIELLRLELGEDACSRVIVETEVPLTQHEQRLVSVVALGPGRAVAPGELTATLAMEAALPVEHLRGEAERHGGLVVEVGDGAALAIFQGGASAFDLVQRGARCALAFRALCPDLRVGLAVGRAVGQRVPTGEAIDRACALLASGGEAGQIRLETLAETLLAGRFEVRADAIGSILEAALDAQTGPGRREVDGPFVGRSRERRTLDALLEECVEEGIACAATLTGPSGIGKTRLLAEWLRSGPVLAARSTVWHLRADAARTSSALSTLGEIARAAAGGVDAASLRDAIVERLAGALPEVEVERVATFLAIAAGAPAPPSAALTEARADPVLMGDQIRRAFEDVTAALAERGPLILAIDDAHHADLASLRVVEAAFRHNHERRLVVLLAARLGDGKRDGLPLSWRGAISLSLAELPPRVCEQYVELRLGARVDRAARARIAEQSGGNPFCLEELTRRGAAEGQPPEQPGAVVAMVQARLEGLPAAARRTLRAASIFGASFWVQGLERLLGGDPTEGLSELVEADVVRAVPSSRVAGARQLEFRQGLYRDAGYAMLTSRDRAAGHRIAAAWLEEVGEPDPIVIADHLERGEAGERAVPWLSLAAARALDGHDFTGALALVGRARTAQKGRGDGCATTPADLTLVEAEALRWRGDLLGAERAASAALEALPEGTIAWYTSLALLAGMAGVSGDFSPAVVLGERLRLAPVAEGAGSARVLALAAVGRRLFQMGDYDGALGVLGDLRDEEVAAGPSLSQRALAEISRLRGAAARHIGDVGGDLAGYGAAVAALEAADDVRGACNARVSYAFSLIQVGDARGARALLERAVADASRLGLSNVMTRAEQNLALVLASEGRLDEARALAAGVCEAARARGDTRFEGWTRIYLARFELAAGAHDAAAVSGARAAELLAGSPPAYAGALAVRALTALAAGDVDGADAAATEAGAILRAYEGIEEFEALVLLAEMSAASAAGDTPRAGELAVAALERVAARAATLTDPRRRADFLAIPENVAIVAAARSRTLGP